jgi:Ca2+-binding RTX toxin-like protein
LTLSFLNKLTITDADGSNPTTYDSAMTGVQMKLIAPDGTVAFTSQPGTREAADGVQEYTFGFANFQGAESKGTWTIEVATYAQSIIRDGKAAIAASDLTVDGLKMDMYGSTPSNDDVYTYTNEFFKMAAISGEKGRTKLVDGNGGTDWINAAAVSKDVTLSLVAGQSTYFGGQKAFTIDRTSVIENAITGDGNDTLTGNRSDNILYGMRGDDVLNGGAGNDTLYGGTGSNRFVFDSKGTSGKDIVGDWMMGDIIATQKALKGVGSDGTITVGADATLLLDGTAKGDTVLLSGLTGAKLQEMGLRDGYYWYAYVSAAAADAGKVVQEAAYHPGAVAAGAVSEIVAANDATVSVSGTGLGAEGAHATIGELDHGFYLYDAMAGSMQGGVQLFA